MQQAILVVDDEVDIVAALSYNLRRDGFVPRSAASGAEAMALLGGGAHFDLVILDLVLPDISGCQLCRQLKTQPHTRTMPVIMLSARGEEIDRVVGLEMGADDYVVKPFSPRELLLRVRAVLKRYGAEEGGPPAQALSAGLLRLDPIAYRVWVDGRDVRLTALEFRLLRCFVGRQGRVQTRHALLCDVWGIRAEVTTRTVDTHVKRLREKLGAAGRYIETLRGVGYRFCGDVPRGDSH